MTFQPRHWLIVAIDEALWKLKMRWDYDTTMLDVMQATWQYEASQERKGNGRDTETQR